MSIITLPRRSSPIPIRKKPLSKRLEIGITMVLIVMGLVLSLLSLSFLFFANSQATQGFHLKTLQEQRADLMLSNEVLAMQIAGTEALDNLEENGQVKKMVNAESPLYLKGTSAVAKSEEETSQN